MANRQPRQASSGAATDNDTVKAVKVLLATAPIWVRRVSEPPAGRYDVVVVETFDDAADTLAKIDAAVVGFHFDNRRPDRLLRLLQERGIPSVCIRGTAAGESDGVISQTIEAYKKELGCRHFIDFVTEGDAKGLVLYAELDALKK